MSSCVLLGDELEMGVTCEDILQSYIEAIGQIIHTYLPKYM